MIILHFTNHNEILRTTLMKSHINRVLLDIIPKEIIKFNRCLLGSE